jgi:hypothetical protein
VGVEADKKVEEWVRRFRVGKDEEGFRRGTNASKGPREGVRADKTPEGGAERNVPLCSLAADDAGLLRQA